MATNDHIREACIDYLRLRGQVGFRKAAAHVILKYGVTSSELSAALADQHLLVSQGADVDARMPEHPA